MEKLKELEDIRVMYVSASGPPPQSTPIAFSQLEKVVPLKRRKFYGVFYPVFDQLVSTDLSMTPKQGLVDG